MILLIGFMREELSWWLEVLVEVCHERGLEEQPPPSDMSVQSGTVSVHPHDWLCLVVLGRERATSVSLAHGETEYLSLFVTQSFLLCPVASTGRTAA